MGADVMERRGCASDDPAFDLRDDRAQDLAEYAMLGALIVVVVIVAMVTLGTQLAAFWNMIAGAFAALP
jgi:Flp pilus assembly pilin Flp